MVSDKTLAQDFMFRKELAKKERTCAERAQSAQASHLSQSATFQRRCPALDHSRANTDTKVQDWAALAGTRRSLATNTAGAGPGINVNHLKYKRDQAFAGTNPYDGGATYNDMVCVNNWAQEQHDKNFKSGFHPKELRRGGRFATEYTERYLPTSEEYRQRLQSTYNTTQRFVGLGRIGPTGIAEPVRPKRANDNSGEHVFYAKEGYGPSRQQDHTAEAKRGNFWVGTVSPTPFESVTATAMRGQQLDFQRRCPSEDAKSKILMSAKSLIDENPRTLRVREELIATNNFPRTWKSMYQTTYADFSRRPQTVA